MELLLRLARICGQQQCEVFMKFFTKIHRLGAVVAIAMLASPALAGDNVAGEALKKLVAGKRIMLAAPGGEFPLNYRRSGVVDGSGEALGLAKFLQPKDSGRWWVAGDKLCQKWTSWYDGKPFCFTIQATGSNSINWRRDDGYSGTARIEN